MGKGPLEGCPCVFAKGPPSSKLRHWFPIRTGFIVYFCDRAFALLGSQCYFQFLLQTFSKWLGNNCYFSRRILGLCPSMIVARWQVWYDYRLSWNSSEYGGVQSIRLPSKLVWTPDILLYNRCVCKSSSCRLKWLCKLLSRNEDTVIINPQHFF